MSAVIIVALCASGFLVGWGMALFWSSHQGESLRLLKGRWLIKFIHAGGILGGNLAVFACPVCGKAAGTPCAVFEGVPVWCGPRVKVRLREATTPNVSGGDHE